MSNSVPEGWAESKLGSIAKLTMGQSPSSDTYNDQGVGLPFFQGKADFGSRTPKVRYWCSQPSKVAEANSILFSVRAPVGEVNLTPYECCIGRGLAGIKAESADQEYLFQKLQFVKPKFGLLSQGSTFEAVNGSEMREFPLVIPPLPEQQKIAAILSSVDDVIEKTRAQIDKLKDLKTGMMQELLTKGIGHTAFKDSPVGRIPEGWNVECLENISEKISDGIHSTPKYAEKSDYRFVNGNNLKGGHIVYGDSAKYVPLDEYNKHKKALTNGTILMSINGTIGNLAFYRGEEVVLGKSAAYISLNEGQSKEFVYFVLQSQAVKTFYELELTGSTINNLSLRSVKNTPIPLPPKKEQRKIAGILAEIDKGICQRNSKLNQFSSLKKALMQDLLTGKVRVNVDNKENAVA
ncbi:Type I restriction-modification system, S subunit [Alcanivorax nanhaiticus]|uniref:Type I restriction-modification system, S subunit n=1 Tax=Alcanivorax nanhaiticus TaxID=1177154 RepID=A0A095SJZ4_9GAMM|nr:restriction endonuclease subunit S [Alcanivorax nanhaiticus]KGD64619.1 Type I restriction-modification system, S subunit [Alcanivorax nanhaiticus]